MTENRLLTTLQQQQSKMEEVFKRVDRGMIDSDSTSDVWEPPVDVGVDGDHLVILMDLPGVAQEQIGIRLNEDCLIVEGRRQPVGEQLRLQRHECPSGFFHGVCICRREYVPSTSVRGVNRACYASKSAV